MRTTRPLLVAGLLMLVAAAPAFADVSGTYDMKFEDVSTNCTTQKLTYKPQPVSIKVRGNSLVVDIDLTPVLVGVPQKHGKLSAKSKSGNTMIGGMKGVFSLAGKIAPDGTAQLVMVGEYSTEQGKSLCTQSWNVTGARTASKLKQ